MGAGEPVGALTTSLTEWLQGMQQGSIVLLAVIMGLMLAFDMGGPINKVAYAFMLICVAQGLYRRGNRRSRDLRTAAGFRFSDADWS